MTDTRQKKERWFAAAMVLLSAGFLTQSFRYPAESAQFPRLLMGAQLLLAFVLLAQSLRHAPAPGPQQGALAALRAPLGVFLAASLYVLAIGQLGYYVSTAVFLSGSIYWFGGRRPLPLISIVGAFLLASHALFTLFLGVRLPAGLLF